MSDLIIKKLEELDASQKKSIEDSTSKLEAKFAADVKTVNDEMAKQGTALGEVKDVVNKMKEDHEKLLKKNGQKSIGSAEVEKQSFIEIAEKIIKDNFEKIKEGTPFRVKAAADMVLGTQLTGTAVATYSPVPALRGRRKVHFRDIPGVQVVPSETGIWKFYKNDIPAGQGSFGNQTEGSAKAQIDYRFTENTITVNTLAGFSRVSRQMLRDLAFIQGFLPGELQEDYLRAEDNSFINTLMSQTAAYTTTATVYAEKCIEWIGKLLSLDYDPTSIVTTASNWQTLLSTKPNDYSIPGGVVITPNGEVAIVGTPVVVQNGMTGTKTFIGDFSRAKVIQATALSIQFFEQDADNVTKNLVTVRAEADVNLAVLRNDAFIYA